MWRSRVLVFVVLASVITAASSHIAGRQGAIQYGVLDLGTVGESTSTAEDIDWLGRVVGTTTGTRERAFLYDGTRAVHLDTIGGTLGGLRSYATAIAPNGQVTGWSNPAGSNVAHAYIF